MILRSPSAVLALVAIPLAAAAVTASAQQSAPAAKAAGVLSLASVPTAGVSIAGSLFVADGRAAIGNNGSITAGEKTARVQLTRGGNLDICATTTVHLSTDKSTPGGALMIALDRGAFEAHYTPGQYSDVFLTPDLRILISPPGEADLSIRVNNQGDTCVDNRGDHAPYVLASSLFAGGAYRIEANQRVLFEHGSIHDVVDNERELCGCPAPVSGTQPGGAGEREAKKAEAENPFPLAESEGLAPSAAPPATPVVPAGEAHAEVEAPLVYNSGAPPAASGGPRVTGSAPLAQAPPKPHRGLFGPIGHFFRRLFGGK